MSLEWSPDEYIRAYKFAATAHLGLTMPGSDLPYIVHVSFVTMEVIAACRAEPGHDEDLAVKCALLHDVIEDTEITKTDISNEFGERVAEGVSALSKNPAIEKAEQLGDSLKRIKTQPVEVWMVKMADRITNLQPPPKHWSIEKIEQYRLQAFQIHDTLKSASKYLDLRLKSKIETYNK